MNISYHFKRTHDVIGAAKVLIGLMRHERWTRKKLEDYQHQRLYSLLAHAARASPFYKEFYKHIRIDRATVLNDLPIIDKAIMMDHFDRLVTDPRLKLAKLQAHIRQLTDDAYYLGRYRVLTTSGSSGLKGVFVFSRQAWRIILAGYMRCGLSTHILPRFPHRLKESTIFADNPVHASYRMKVSGQFFQVHSQRLSATASIDSHVKALNAFQPEVLSAYPSIIALLAIEQLEGRLNIQPRMIGIGGETHTTEMVSNVQAAWGITPFDLYGTTEGGAFNMDCPFHHGIHIAEDLTIMEVVDEQNRPVPDGTPGYKLLITNLFNYSQPLIRYEVSDMVTVSKELCPCGRPFRLIARVDGRNDDIIYLPDARGRDTPVHPIHFATALGVIQQIREYRVVHEKEGLVISVVLRKEDSGDCVAAEIRANLTKSLKSLDVHCPGMHIQFVKNMERGPHTMGKVKLVQSRVKRPAGRGF